MHEIRLPEELDHTSLRELRDRVLSVDHGETIVLHGANDRVFCRGLSLGSLMSVSAEERTEGFDAFEQTILHLAAGASPAIAAIDGVAMGGGLGLAAACDVVLATRRAEVGLPELLFGLVPGMIFPVLQLRASGPDLRRLALEGAGVSVETAARYRLVDQVVEEDLLERTTQTWVRKFRRTERHAVGRLKRWAAGDALAREVRVGREHLAELATSEIARRRIEAFAEGLAPWEGEC